MPCRLCETQSEMFPQAARFSTPLMAAAIPHFNAKTDFLCPHCFVVYFEVIELKYGDKIRKYLYWTCPGDASSTRPPSPPAPVRERVQKIECSAFSSRFAPMLQERSLEAAKNCYWVYDFQSPILPGSKFLSCIKPRYPYRKETPEPPFSMPPIEAAATITIDFPIEESQANVKPSQCDTGKTEGAAQQ